jgi:hypothetical protein
MIKRNGLTDISSHAIMRARQRFELKDKKQTIILLKKALKDGELIEETNKFNFVLKYNEMYLIISDGVLKTVLDYEQYKSPKPDYIYSGAI